MAAPIGPVKCFDCKGCDYNKEMYRRLNDGLATSLRERCLQYMASNSYLLTLDDLKGMPCEILGDFKWYMCANDLLKFESVFIECGIGTNRVWEKHLCRRYRHAFRLYTFGQMYKIEVADIRCHTAQAIYMNLHSSQMLFPILLSRIDRMDCAAGCYQDLLLYLRFTPYLMLTVPRTSLLDNDKTFPVLQTMRKYVKHIEFKQRGTLDVSNQVVELIKYFRCNSSVTSCSFSMPRTSQDFKQRLYMELTNEHGKLQLMKGIKTDISEYIYELFHDDDTSICNNGTNRMCITPCVDWYLNSSRWLHGLKHLSHLTIHGPSCGYTKCTRNVDNVLEALNDCYRDPLGEPLKYLGFSNLNFLITLKHGELSDMSYAVEEMNMYDCDFQDVHSEMAMLIFIQGNRCLCRLNMLSTNTSQSRSQDDPWNIICSKSDLQCLTTPVNYHLQHVLHSMLRLSKHLTFLHIQWHEQWDCDVVIKALSMLKDLKRLKTLVLRHNALGGFLPTILSSVFINGEYPALRYLDMSGCRVKGVELISVAQTIWRTRGKHGRKLQVLDMSMNVINRQEQREINALYKDLTEILLLEIADRSLAFSDV